MVGQYSIWDIHEGPVRKPCEYSFPRYIGQRVVFWRDGLQGVITEIGPYYTTVRVGSDGTMRCHPSPGAERNSASRSF